MSMPNAKESNTVSMFLFLMGTLVFSLSTLPGHGNAEYGTTSLSSEIATDCDQLRDDIDGGQESGTCKITPRSGDLAKFEGVVQLNRASIKSRDGNDKVVTTEGWQATVEILCKKSCPDDMDNSFSRPIPIKLTNFRDITAKALSVFKVKAKEAAKEVREAQQLKNDIEDCKIDANDTEKELKGNARMKCLVGRLEDMDADTAADYYKTNIQPEILNLVGSDDISNQSRGYALLTQMQNQKLGGEFVQESVNELKKFTEVKVAGDKMKTEILGMPGGPARDQKIAQMKYLEAAANDYFVKQGGVVKAKSWDDTNFDYGQALFENMNDYQLRLQQAYAPVTQNSQLMSNANVYNGQNNAIQYGDARLARAGTVATGAPVVPFPGQQQVAQPNAISSLATSVVPQVQQQQLRGATGIPQVGGQVRIK